MRIVSVNNITRQGGFGLLAGCFFVLWAFFSSSAVQAGPNTQVKILYFFSTTCRHCIDAKPYVIELSKEYPVEGLRFGEGEHQTLPFPVKAGDKNVAKTIYDVKGVPTLAVIIDGVFRQKIAGTPDIQDAKVIVKALSRGAMTVSEAARKTDEAEITVAGWVGSKGEYFKDARFFMTDRKTEIPVKAWLPLEVAKSPFHKERPRLMSDVVKKPVILKGAIKKTRSGVFFFVKKEVTND